jgi:hydroxyacylglutathione hydrolase
MALVDPARDPQPYYDFAQKHSATIKAIIETHPHADFVSSHAEISRTTGASIFVSRLVGAAYEHIAFDDGDVMRLCSITLKAVNTPGHSPDSICVVAAGPSGDPTAVFTGDTLFIGDCGRPDLRESAGAIQMDRKELAQDMYRSLRVKLGSLPDHTLVYPAHGAGSLCGKALSQQGSSTMGEQRLVNWSLQSMSEETFVEALLKDQPFVPKYFPYNVAVNKEGAPTFKEAISTVPITSLNMPIEPGSLVIDTRTQADFEFVNGSITINLMLDTKFETWLGSMVDPGEKFYLVTSSEEDAQTLLQRIAKIGYEGQVLAVLISAKTTAKTTFNPDLLRSNETGYTIVDVRNESEVKMHSIFDQAIEIPLHQLRERVSEIPLSKPIVVHCAGGYRSAAASSLLQSLLPMATVYDLSVAVKSFEHVVA